MCLYSWHQILDRSLDFVIVRCLSQALFQRKEKDEEDEKEEEKEGEAEEAVRDTQDLGGGADVGALRFIGFLNHGDVAVGGSLIDFSVLCSRAVQNFIAWHEAFRSARLPGILCNPFGTMLLVAKEIQPTVCRYLFPMKYRTL